MHIWLLHLVSRVSGISHRWVLCLFLVFGGIVLGEMTQTATFGPLKVLLVLYSSLSRICVCCVCLFLSLFLISKICNVGHIDSHTFCFLNEILQRLLDVTPIFLQHLLTREQQSQKFNWNFYSNQSRPDFSPDYFSPDRLFYIKSSERM